MRADDKDYLTQRALELGLDRADILTAAQKFFDQAFPRQVRARSYLAGVMRVTTQDASVASELRLRQIELMRQLNLNIDTANQITQLNIQIRD
jgi:hypothetical protein